MEKIKQAVDLAKEIVFETVAAFAIVTTSFIKWPLEVIGTPVEKFLRWGAAKIGFAKSDEQIDREARWVKDGISPGIFKEPFSALVEHRLRAPQRMARRLIGLAVVMGIFKACPSPEVENSTASSEVTYSRYVPSTPEPVSASLDENREAKPKMHMLQSATRVSHAAPSGPRPF